jgi:hypothetical protein
LQAELDALAAMPESEIDTTEMPSITDWSHAVCGPGAPEPRIRPIIHQKGRSS